MEFFTFLVPFYLAFNLNLTLEKNEKYIPFDLAVKIYVASEYHDVDPIEVFAILLAENKSLKFKVEKVGENGEMGLFQIDPGTWVPYVNEKIKETPGIFIKDEIKKKDLFDPSINLEVAIIAIKYMQERHKGHSNCPDWRAHYRCAKNSRNTKSCKASVSYVKKIEKGLREVLEK